MSLRDTALSDMAESKRQLGAQITEQYKLIDELRSEVAQRTRERDEAVAVKEATGAMFRELSLWGHLRLWWFNR